VDPYYALELYAIAFVVIWVFALLFKDKLKIDVEGPVLMRRTTRLRGFIDSIAQKSPRFWRWSMNIGVPVAVFLVALIFVLLAYSLVMVIQNMFIVHGASASTAGVYPVIPGVSIPGSPINVPLGYGLVALAIVIVFHEFAHGILARAEGIKIKSIGLLMLAVIPGAFVEPDEEEVNKSGRFTKLRIYAAGSISNIVVAIIALLISYLLIFSFINPSFHSQGVEIQTVMPHTPSAGVLQTGMIITNINGNEITNSTSFSDVMSKTKPGDLITVTTNQGTYKIKSTANPNNSSHGYLGVSASNHLTVNQDISSKYGNILPWLLFGLYQLLFWISLLNLGIGTANLIPLKPFDGGLILEEILNYLTPKDTAKQIANTVSVISLFLIVSSLSLSLLPALI
jgi:membrane-associated protease RseP (regulator of RpoE activity)